MNCPETSGLTFSTSGVKAIGEIRQIQGLSNMLAVLVGSTALTSLFGDRGRLESPLKVAENISDTD